MFEFEEWKKIDNYDCLLISNYGRVKRLQHIVNSGNGAKRIIKEHIYEKVFPSDNGYYHISTSYYGKHIVIYPHLEAAKAFIPNPYKLPQINHKDENKANNCIWNLEWCTSKYNANYGTRIKRYSEKNCVSVLQFTKDGQFVAAYESVKNAEIQTNVNRHNISSCCTGKRKTAGGFVWKYK